MLSQPEIEEILNAVEEQLDEVFAAVFAFHHTGLLDRKTYYRLWRDGMSTFVFEDIWEEYYYVPLSKNARTFRKGIPLELSERYRVLQNRMREFEDADSSIRVTIEQYYTRMFEEALLPENDPKKQWFDKFNYFSGYPGRSAIRARFNYYEKIPGFARVMAMKNLGEILPERQQVVSRQDITLYMLQWQPRKAATKEWFDRQGTAESTMGPLDILGFARLGVAALSAVGRLAVKSVIKRVLSRRLGRALRDRVSKLRVDISKNIPKRQRGLPNEARGTEKLTAAQRGAGGGKPTPQQRATPKQAAPKRTLADVDDELAEAQRLQRQAWDARVKGGAHHKNKIDSPAKQKLYDDHIAVKQRADRLRAERRALRDKQRAAQGPRGGLPHRADWKPFEDEVIGFFRDKLGKGNVFKHAKVAATTSRWEGKVPRHLIKNNRLDRAGRYKAGLSGAEVQPELVVRLGKNRHIMIDAKHGKTIGGSKQVNAYNNIERQGRAVIITPGPDGAKVGTVVHGKLLRIHPEQLKLLKSAKTPEALRNLIEQMLK